MKTAEEWIQKHPIDGVRSIEGLRKVQERGLVYIKAIQLDAWKQGMSDANNLIQEMYNDFRQVKVTPYLASVNLHSQVIDNAIQDKINKTTSLPNQ